ncbi:protease modulator HflC [Sphingomonas arenae]|uniref:protease modulator HflC n=1 Tax=Sphingomonas arenae TaxID=2812555 RepID=UPI001F2F0069|nr:protease modulator HflC [Sphingomonas arenae]
MIDAIIRRPILWSFVAVFTLVMLLSSVIIVPETKQALIVQFGKPDRILGATQAGINWRIPFFDQTVWVDKRVRPVDMERQQVLSTDQRRLEVDAFARYRIINPLRMYIAARSEDRLSEVLRPILGSELRNELGKREFASLLSAEREGVTEAVRRNLDRVARQYGAQIVDVRIKKADLPDGAPLESAYGRMRSAREQEARSILAQGAKEAQIIRAEADAQAARTYAAAFGKDPQFYDFYRAMQSYQTTFLDDGNGKPAGTTVVLSPDNDFLREFTGRGAR